MYVTKVMYNLNPMGNYSLQEVVGNCVNHYFDGLETINKLQPSKDNPIDEKMLFEEYYGNKISFNTDLLQLEIVISSTDLITNYKLDQQILDCSSFDGLQIKIFKLNNTDYYCYSL